MNTTLYLADAPHAQPTCFLLEFNKLKDETLLCHHPKLSKKLFTLRLVHAEGRAPDTYTKAELNMNAEQPPVAYVLKVSPHVRVLAADGTVLQEGTNQLGSGPAVGDTCDPKR